KTGVITARIRQAEAEPDGNEEGFHDEAGALPVLDLIGQYCIEAKALKDALYRKQKHPSKKEKIRGRPATVKEEGTRERDAKECCHAGYEKIQTHFKSRLSDRLRRPHVQWDRII